MKKYKINWEEQWALHAPGYHDGYAHIDLSHYGVVEPLLLTAGAGFGDLSHPTTRLALELIPPYIKEKNIFDIGCGSGILALAALKMGARAAYGTDIDAPSIQHANKNAALNKLQDKSHFFNPSESPIFPKNLVGVMNMISSEQKIAWNFHSHLYPHFSIMITTGILKSEHTDYLDLTSSWGWSLMQEKEEKEWKAYIFKMEHTK